jgi:hypothetical protein
MVVEILRMILDKPSMVGIIENSVLVIGGGGLLWYTSSPRVSGLPKVKLNSISRDHSAHQVLDTTRLGVSGGKDGSLKLTFRFIPVESVVRIAIPR